jgi:hypothetical protein
MYARQPGAHIGGHSPHPCAPYLSGRPVTGCDGPRLFAMHVTPLLPDTHVQLDAAVACSCRRHVASKTSALLRVFAACARCRQGLVRASLGSRMQTLASEASHSSCACNVLVGSRGGGKAQVSVECLRACLSCACSLSPLCKSRVSTQYSLSSL